MLWSQIKLNSVLGSFISVLNPSKSQFCVCEIAIMIPVRSAVVRISRSRVTAEDTSEINYTSKHPNENIIIVVVVVVLLLYEANEPEANKHLL